jgi:hypothetical protein
VRDLERSLREAKGRKGFRVIAYSFQRDHVHLLVEAEDTRALARGMKSIGARIARAVRRAFGGAGSRADGALPPARRRGGGSPAGRVRFRHARTSPRSPPPGRGCCVWAGSVTA